MMELLEILSHSRLHGSKSEAKFMGELIDTVKTIGGKHDHFIMHLDAVGNLWAELGEPKQYPYLFVSHVDTCAVADVPVNPVVDKHGYVRLPENSLAGCLGADDGVGVYCNLRMMESGVKGTYLFCRGEEKGLIGASFIAEQTPSKLKDFLLCVEVDRAGKTEIVVEQCTGKGASNEFGEALGKALDMGHVISYDGVFTDNSAFNIHIPENVNLAAGYDRQHSHRERLDYNYALTLAEKMCKVEWGKLPIKRDRSDVEYSSTHWGGYNHGYSNGGPNWGHGHSAYIDDDLDWAYSGRKDLGNGTSDDGWDDLGYDEKAYVPMTEVEAMTMIQVSPEKVANLLWAMGITRADINEYWINRIPF